MRNMKAKINLAVDITIGLAFLGEAISGLVLWLALPSGGYQGGRGVVETMRFFLLDRQMWRAVHDWLAVAMVAGVILHIALHWNWIVCMLRNMWREAFPARPRASRGEAQPQECKL